MTSCTMGHEPENRILGLVQATFLGDPCNSVDQGLDWQTFSIKDKKVNIFCFVDHMVFVQLLSSALAVQAFIDNPYMNDHGCVLIKLNCQPLV